MIAAQFPGTKVDHIPGMSQEAYWAFIHNYLVKSGPKGQTEWSQTDLATAVQAWVATVVEAALAKIQKEKQCGKCQEQ